MPTEAMRALCDDYLSAMAGLATGVSVVTTDGPAGRRGLTVSAVTSVSIDDAGPILLVCVNDRSGAGRDIVANGCFGVNMLGQDQASLAERFASRTDAIDRFAGLSLVQGASGAPRLAKAFASFDCQVLAEATMGTHRVLYGRVLSVSTGADRGPLIYSGRRFCSVAPITAAA